MVFDRIGLVRKLISSYLVTIQYRSKHLLHRNCEGTEQLPYLIN